MKRRVIGALPKINGALSSTPGTMRDVATARAIAGTAITKPATGPLRPTSKRARRVVIGEQDADERAERADERGRGNEVRIADVDAVDFAGDVVPHFIGEENTQQRERERDAGAATRMSSGAIIVANKSWFSENGSRFAAYDCANSAPTASVEITVSRRRTNAGQSGRLRTGSGGSGSSCRGR